jgi:hypothetical protein
MSSDISRDSCDFEVVAEQGAAGNTPRTGQLTDYGNSNIIIADYVPLRRLCLSLVFRRLITLIESGE